VPTVVGLRGQPASEFKVGYLPHGAAVEGPLVFVSNYGTTHVRSSDLTDDSGNTLSVVDLSRPDAAAKATPIDFSSLEWFAFAITPTVGR
jgi:hypothetical protein